MKALLRLMFMMPLAVAAPAFALGAGQTESQTEVDGQPSRWLLRVVDEDAEGFSCVPRRTCKIIATCEEARWYLANCSWGSKLDRDSDGVPCESGPC